MLGWTLGSPMTVVLRIAPHVAALFLVVTGCSTPSTTGADGGASTREDAPGPAPLLDFDGGFGPRPDVTFAYPLDEVLRMDDVQLEGTHNSYHLAPNGVEPGSDYDYSMAPIDVQLESQGVRELELDLHWAAERGAYRVYHEVGDAHTTCELFVECLAEVRRWSDAHPGHQPIYIQVEPKDWFGFFPAELVDERLARIDAEIRMVFPDGLVVTPDEVQGDAGTVAAALRDRGWPTLGAARGRVLFHLLCGEFCAAYAHGDTSLAGREMFPMTSRSSPFASVLLIDDAQAHAADIAAAIDAGLIVRSRSDLTVTAALADDHSALQAALDAGAHLISTNFPAPVPETSFYVAMPGGTPSRCNPVTAPPDCTPEAIESPERLASPP